MSTIIIRNVPDDVHAILKQRAAAEGLSLQKYVLRILVEHARRPTEQEVQTALKRLGHTETFPTHEEIMAEIRLMHEEAARCRAS